MLNYNAGTKSTFVCLEKKMIRFWCTHSLVLVNCLNECWLRSLDILRQHSFRQFTNTNESIGSASTLFPEHFDTKYQMTLAYVRLNIMHILIWFFPTNWICQMHLTYYKFVSSTFNLCWKKIRLYACYIQSNLCKCHWQKILLCQSDDQSYKNINQGRYKFVIKSEVYLAYSICWGKKSHYMHVIHKFGYST